MRLDLGGGCKLGERAVVWRRRSAMGCDIVRCWRGEQKGGDTNPLYIHVYRTKNSTLPVTRIAHPQTPITTGIDSHQSSDSTAKKSIKTSHFT